MPKILKYQNVLTSTTVPLGGSTATLKVPCMGAKQMVFTIRATGGGVLGSTTAWGFQFQGDAGFTNPAGVQVVNGGAGINVVNNGIVVAVCPAGVTPFIDTPFLAIILNGGGATDTTGVVVDCFVFYDTDRVKLDTGQDAAVPA